MAKLTALFVPSRRKAYFFSSAEYLRYDVSGMTVDAGYPKPIAGNWKGAFDRDIDAAVLSASGEFVYFFRGERYVKVSLRDNTAVPGYPRPIAGNWHGLFEAGIDAAVPAADGTHAYFFRGDEYVKYDLVANRVVAGYPKDIAGNWHGLFEKDVDTALGYPPGFAYFFRGDECVKHDLGRNTAVAGYPRPITADWPGLPDPAPAAGSGRSAREAFGEFITPYEGRVAWLYLDVKALVTIGVGNLVDPERYALDLPLIHPRTGARATRDEISAEWRRVKGDPSLAVKGHRAAEAVTELRLTEESIDELLRAKLESNEETLRAAFPDWDDWPADAQLAVHGMAWAMGPGFPAKFPKFSAAARRQDWLAAAAECSISGASARRNLAHASLFGNAAAVVDRGLDRVNVYYPEQL